MSAAPLADDHPVLHLLAAWSQPLQWAQSLSDHVARGRRLVVAHSPDRRSAADALSRAYGGRRARLDAIQRRSGLLRRDDLMVVVAAPVGALGYGLEPGFAELLHRGVMVWGLTGPRPNPLADHCHDSIAVPVADPALLLQAHALVVRRLVTSAARVPADQRPVSEATRT